MKNLLALASAFALASCGMGEAAVTEASDDTAPALASSPLVGIYGGEGEDGMSWTSTLNSDGSYSDTVGGALTETGHWSFENDQICFFPDVEAGADATQTCLGLETINEDGSLLVSDGEGRQMTVPRISD